MDYKDAYHALRSQHSDLQRKYHDRAEELKRTNVQLSKIENLMRAKERLEGGPPTTLAMREENEAIIKGLYQDKARLERRNGELDRKCRALVDSLEKKKREVAVLKRAARTGPRRLDRPTTAPEHVDLGASRVSFSSSGETTGRRKNVDALVEKFKRRVEEAEDQLQRVKEDNKELRSKLQRQGRPLVVNSVKEVRSPMADKNRGFSDDNAELREAKAEAQLLEMRYKQLEENTRAQRDVQKAQFDQLDEYNRRIRDLRRALQDSEADKDKLRLDADRVDELQERVTELQTANRRLEDELLNLSDVALNQDFSGRDREKERVAQLERNDARARAEFDNLRKSAEGTQEAFVALQQQVDDLRAAKNRAEHELQQLKLRSSTEQVQSTVNEDKAKLFGGLDGVDMEELERALTIVKKREHMKNPDDFDFLEKIDPEIGNDLRQADFKKKLEELRERHLQTQYELERAEKMLKVQMSINRDLHLELEDASSKKSAKHAELLQKVEDYEALNVKRLQRIHTLEAQLKQARYSTKSSKLRAIDEDDRSETTESTNLLLAELNDGDLQPDENLVEVWVVSASLDEGVVSPNASTFAVVDFLTYESQATQWLPGSKPEFDFATSYKVSVDDLFLRYLATESLSLEICEAQQADYELLAKASIPLAPLLDSKPTLILDKQPLIAARTGRQAGYVHVEIRLALPVTELYQMFLDRHPTERANIEKAMLETLNQPMVGESDDSARLENEIEVVVHSAVDLPTREGRSKPSPYVHYQFLQFQDAFTPVTRSSCDPTFEHVLSYPMATTTQACALLRTERLTFTVLDFQEENASIGDADDALIGTCEVPLSLLSDGESVFSTATLLNDTGREVGTLRVCVRWKHAFKQARTPDGSALDEKEVNWCLERFSPRKDGQVDYLSFLHAVDAPPRVDAARQELVAFVEKRRLETGASGRDILESIDVEALSEDEFADALKAMGCQSSADELCAFLRHARKAHSGRFGLEELLQECRRAPPAEASVRVKMKAQAERLRRLGRELAGPFEDLDPARSGRLPRPHFRQGLRGLGFDLVDEPSQKVEDLFEDKRKHDVAQLLGAELVSDAESEDDLIDRHTKARLAAFEVEEDQQKQFEEKMRRMEESNREALNAPAPAPVFVEQDPIRNLRAEAPVPSSPPAHRASVEAVSPIRQDYDDLNVSVAATLPVQDSREVETSSLLDAERALLSALAKKSTDLGKVFRKVDASSTGVLSRKEFAYALGKKVQLTSADVGALMDHFSSSQGVDYKAFLRFAEDQKVPLSAAAKALDRIAVHAGTLQRLQSADSSMTGSLPADTFGTVLRSLGHDLDGNELRNITQLFPPRRAPKGLEQHVDYEAFYEACADRKASLSLKDVDGRLRKAVLDILAKGGPEQLREEFRRADRQGRSSLDRTDAEALLDTLLGSPACSRDEARAVLARLDSVGDGVTYDALIKFAKEEEEVKPYSTETQDWAHLKVRVKACLVESYDRLGNERGDAVVRSCFKRYDWKGADVLSSELFAQSCRNAGILLGSADLRALAERFETSSNTAYNRFLTWALEASQEPSSRKEEKHARRAKEALERISPLLREARRWGVRAFERYDRDERGVVDRRDFERILEDFNCDLEGKELKALCHQYSGDEGVDYKSFVQAVEGDKVESVLVVTADAADVLRDALKVKVREGIDYRAAFEREDGSYAGTLDRKALERVLRQLDINLEAKQLDDLERKFRAATSGGIHYVELLNAVLPTRPTVGDNWRVEEKLRAMIKRRFEWWQPGALRRAYKHFDTKRKNKLLPADLADGLRALKVKLSAQQEQDLFDSMDLDKDGTVSYTEFIVFVRDPCHPFLEQKVRYATHRAKLRPSDAEDALRDVDDNRSGLVGLRDFGVVLERLGVELTSSERKRLAQRFDGDESGNVSSSAFLAFLKGDVESGEGGNPSLASLKRELRNSKKDVGRCFREFDDEDRGVLGLRDFRRFLEALGCELDASDVKACAEALGDDGLVSLKKFRKFAEDESSDHDDMIRKAAKKLKVSQRDAKKAFLRYDEDESGEVSSRNFERVLDKLGFELDKDVIEAFDGKYLKFVKLIEGEDEDDDDVDGVLKKLRKESRALRRSLEGDISERRLRNAADDAGVRLSTADLKALTKSFEGRRDDIDGDKLQRALSKGDDSDDDDKVLRKLSKEVKRLNRKDPDYERVLRDFERDDGELSKKDFRKALERLGFELEDDDIEELVEKFGRRGVVKSRKFLEAIEEDRSSSDDDDDKVKKACKGLQKKLKRAFEKVDEDEEGRVSRKKFQRVLEDVGVDLTSRDLERVMDKFEKRDKVDYGKFLKSVSTEDDDDDDVFGAIKSALKEAKEDGEDPMKVFEKLDRDSAGELDADDVKRALKKLGYTPTAFELKKCQERFPGKKEDVNYEDLVADLMGKKKRRSSSSDSDDESERGRSPSKSRSHLKKLKKELVKLEERKGRRLKFDKYFEAYDSEGKDYVSERDFRKALQKLGVELDDDKKAFEACASKWDKRGDGRIRWRDFVSWARDDSSSDERNPSRTRERRSRSRSRGRR